MADDTLSPLSNVITIDDERMKSHLDRVVRGSVEETLNALLDAEADRLCNAQRYERSEARRDTRAVSGRYDAAICGPRIGPVLSCCLSLPGHAPGGGRARSITDASPLGGRERRGGRTRGTHDDLGAVSVRRVEDITEASWGTRVSPSTVSDLNKKIYGTIEAWRNRPIEGEHPYVYLDGSCSSAAGVARSQRLAAGCDRCERRGLSGDFGHLRGGEGGQGGLERFPQASQGAWLDGHSADYLRCVYRARRERGGVLSGGGLAEMHRGVVEKVRTD